MSEASAPPGPTALLGATLPDGRTADVHLRDGRVSAVEASLSDRPTPPGALHLGGALLLPALVDGHAHLDKTLRCGRPLALGRGGRRTDPPRPGACRRRGHRRSRAR
ncbi:hypothetical protein AB0F16_40560, partial [Streptomyces tanashiensis]